MTALDTGICMCPAACSGSLCGLKMGHGERDQGAKDHQGS